jgi:hypothetical protein
MADKIYVDGFRGFKKHDKAPDFVLGTLIITLKEFGEFLKKKEIEPFFTEYEGKKQLKISVLRSKDGGLSFQVDQYKKEAKEEDPFN